MNKINWICNCVKHYDGFPAKKPKLFTFSDVDESIRLKIQPNEFKRDCDTLIELYPTLTQLVILIAQHRLLMDMLNDDTKNDFPDLYEQQAEAVNKLETMVKSCIDNLKPAANMMPTNP